MKWREKSSARIEKASACPAITVQRENSRRIRRRKAYGFDSSRKNADGALIAKRDYGYDALDRVVSRVQTRGNGESTTTRTDAFGCNSRSELTSATLGNAAYAYAFDYIGNRNSASEAGTQLAYAANALNQYSTITETEAFTPTYDADGNATSVKTATGTWSISCHGENRPVRFENAATQTVIECGYDSLGRRFEKKVSVAGTLVSHERYVYRGYLQIAAFDVAGTQEPALKRVIYWDPTEETATRPLAISIAGDNVYFPTVDLTKNVCELVNFYGNVAATYDYAPFGNVSAASPSGSAVPANPLQWSSEIYDSELDLVYYNYRHYSPTDGRWLSRDPIEEEGGLNLYVMNKNNAITTIDTLGLAEWFPGTSPWRRDECCGDKKYNSIFSCCIDSNGKRTIHSRQEKSYTGVSYYVRRTRWYYFPIYRPWSVTQLFLTHAWFNVDDGAKRAGSYPNRDYPSGIYIGEEKYALEEQSVLTFKTDIYLSVCKYDVGKFSQCIKGKADKGNNWHIWNNCLDWVYDAINECKKEVKRK